MRQFAKRAKLMWEELAVRMIFMNKINYKITSFRSLKSKGCVLTFKKKMFLYLVFSRHKILNCRIKKQPGKTNSAVLTDELNWSLKNK